MLLSGTSAGSPTQLLTKSNITGTSEFLHKSSSLCNFTFKRNLCIFLQVVLQLLVVHVLLAGERGGDRRINPAEVQPARCSVAQGSVPATPPAQGGAAPPSPDAQHGEADTVAELLAACPLGLCGAAAGKLITDLLQLILTRFVTLSPLPVLT